MAPTLKTKPTRCFNRFTSDDRANRAASHRMHHRQRTAVGDFFYVHPAAPGIAFRTAGDAMRAALTATFWIADAA